MTWEYLDTDPFQARFGIVHSYLRDKVWGKTIVDLNCGHNAPLVHYVPARKIRDGFSLYYGNDINLDDEISYGNGRVILERIEDEKVPERLEEILDRLDVLVLLGHATGNEQESDTALGVWGSLLVKWKPSILIHEAASSFVDLITKIEDMTRLLDYQIDQRLRLIIEPDDGFVRSRIFTFYRG